MCASSHVQCKLARTWRRGFNASELLTRGIDPRPACLLACLPAWRSLPPPSSLPAPATPPQPPPQHVLLVRYTIPVYSAPLVRFVSPRQGERARNREATPLPPSLSNTTVMSHSTSAPPRLPTPSILRRTLKFAYLVDIDDGRTKIISKGTQSFLCWIHKCLEVLI